MIERIGDINTLVNSEVLLDISFHAQQGGETYVHDSAVEVKLTEQIPDGMEIISVPRFTYAECKHHKGQTLKESYNNMYRWIHQNQYKETNPDGLTRFEKYPMIQDPYPEFDMMIPVIK
ncbi:MULTISPECIES: effector binding domain-containing protein [Sporosarcina]|uniref:GyrI-like domain-containing protein n=1 Tax=Sporosarcina contaminans TaxID=633403 RepID=A0ABW3TY12_9BACL